MRSLELYGSAHGGGRQRYLGLARSLAGHAVLGLLVLMTVGSWAGAQGQADPTQHERGFWGIVLAGGWVGVCILLLLLGLSLTAAYLVFDNLSVLRRGALMPEGIADKVHVQLKRGDLGQAAEVCRAQPSSLSFVLLHGLQEQPWGWGAMEKSLEDALAEQSARLLRRIDYLSVIGNLAPMVGLLGTVTGMIFAFQRVADTQGAASAAELAEGIYQALITTVGGLIVAIPSLGAFAVLRNRLDQLMAEMAFVIQRSVTPLKQLPAGNDRPAVPPEPPDHARS